MIKQEKNNKKKIFLGANILILILIVIAVVAFYAGFSETIFEEKKEIKCQDLDVTLNVNYDACFNNQTNRVILLLKRGQDNLVINNISVFLNKQLYLLEVPEVKKTRRFEFETTNPEKITFLYDLQNITLCKNIETISVRYCTEKELTSISSEITKDTITLS